MRFDPHIFLALAKRNGFEIIRDDDQMVVRPSSRITDEWRDAFKRHKQDLLGYLPHEKECCR